jgi:hypothetical protein
LFVSDARFSDRHFTANMSTDIPVVFLPGVLWSSWLVDTREVAQHWHVLLQPGSPSRALTGHHTGPPLLLPEAHQGTLHMAQRHQVLSGVLHCELHLGQAGQLQGTQQAATSSAGARQAAAAAASQCLQSWRSTCHESAFIQLMDSLKALLDRHLL